jgi:hypothetical protein
MYNGTMEAFIAWFLENANRVWSKMMSLSTGKTNSQKNSFFFFFLGSILQKER